MHIVIMIIVIIIFTCSVCFRVHRSTFIPHFLVEIFHGVLYVTVNLDL